MINKILKADEPNNPLSQMAVFIDIVKCLRKDCPWDNKQTHRSIAHLMIEEAYEVVDAINLEDYNELKKELGDLLLHIVMQSVIAEEAGSFNLADVIGSINEKMVNRHPHVFGDVQAGSTEEVLDNWEKIKMTEGRKSALEGVPNSLPALLRAERIQEKASRVGFDWEDKQDVWAKVAEETNEFKVELEKGSALRKEEEFGDLLFSLVNVARFEGIVPEQALQGANGRFTKRFQYVEEQAKAKGLKLMDMTLAQMDELWNEAKQIERIHVVL